MTDNSKVAVMELSIIINYKRDTGGKNVRITAKLIISYLTLAIIVILLGTLSYFGLHTINEGSSDLYNDRLQPTITLTEIAQKIENTRVQMTSGVAYEDPASGKIALMDLDRIDILLEEYQNRNMGEEEEAKFTELQSNWEIFSENVRGNVETLSAQLYDETLEGLRNAEVSYSATSTNVTELIDIVDNLALSEYETNQNVFSTLRWIIMIASVIATVFAIAIGILMGRLIGSPLKDISGKLSKIAHGDLTEDIKKTNRKDEIGILVNTTRQMQHELKILIEAVSDATMRVLSSSEELTQSTNEVVTGAEQIAVTMQELATGSETQAGYSSDLADSMNGFAKTIEESSRQSDQVYKTSNQVHSLTEDGKDKMDNSVQQMRTIDDIVKNSVTGVKELDNKSNKISKLVNVIEEIAEQTNLLALNAAIEAARVGEQGKGFAVVADEIRKLAEQVSVSVVDITDIVNDIQSESSKVVTNLETGYAEVEKGTSQIQQMGETFNKISSSINTMGNAIKEISEKLTENKATTFQMNAKLGEIASLSEESAAGIEQTSASSQQTTSTMQEVSSSSEELAKLAEELNLVVERFTV